MYYPACLLALLLVLSVQGMEVVARVRFSQQQYTVKERGPNICVDVINELNPADRDFTVSFSFSTTLTGEGGSFIQATRSDFLYFSASSRTVQLCFPHTDDSIPCEDDIIGTLRLLNNSGVNLGNPSSAAVTIQDDDYAYATFDRAIYTVVEGANNVPSLIINTTFPTGDVQLQISQAPRNVNFGMVEYSLNYPRTEISLQQERQPLSLNIEDDDIALEDPEVAILELRTSSGTTCPNVKISPRNSTTILILDDDTVTVKLTNSQGKVLEGERYEACITLSKATARILNLQLRVQYDTADTDDFELSSDVITVDFPSHSNNLRKCIIIPTLQDNVLEDNESFKIELSDHTVLPTSIRGNLMLGTSISTIVIQDTSTCTGVTLNTDSTIYVYGGRTLCFSCITCDTDILWNITSYQGEIWGGRSGENLQSEVSSQERGAVLPDGTLQVTNSSSLFSRLTPGILQFTDLSSRNINKSHYKVFIGEEAEVTELNIDTTNDIIRLTCLYRGTPEPQLDWLTRSRPVNERNIISRVDSEEEDHFKSILSVNRTIAESFTIYTCRASNHLGDDSSDVSISPPSHNSSSINSSKDLSHFTAYICIFSLVLSHFL